VRQRADRWNTIGSPKKSDAARREIPLAPIVVNTLRAWKLACPKGELNLVFPNGEGNVERHANLHTRGLARAQFAAGLTTDPARPKYGLHSLRHAAASPFIEQGLSPKRVQALMAHSTIQMTFDVYSHLWPSADDDQVAFDQLQVRLLVA
jgi:integrase